MLQRAPKQQKAFIEFLSSLQGNLLTPDSRLLSPVSEITRDELLNQGHSLQTITALIKRGLLETYEQEVGRLNHGGEPHLDKIQPLSPVQQDAYNQIQFSFLKKNVTLLHGVTSPLILRRGRVVGAALVRAAGGSTRSFASGCNRTENTGAAAHIES